MTFVTTILMSFDDILLNLHNFMGILLWKPCPLFSLAAVVVAFAAAASPAHTRCPTQFQQPHRIQNQVFAPHISNRFETNEQDVSEEVTDQLASRREQRSTTTSTTMAASRPLQTGKTLLLADRPRPPSSRTLFMKSYIWFIAYLKQSERRLLADY